MILQALSSAYDRFAREKRACGKPRVPPYGYSNERISYALVLNNAGKLLDIQVVGPDELDVPSDPRVTRTKRIEPMFLWDKTAYALGLALRGRERTAEEHEAFKERQRKIIRNNDDDGLRAFLKFLDAWTPSATHLPRYQRKIVGANVVFRLEGSGYLHERPAARKLWQRYLRSARRHQGACLITGERGRIALTHPTIGPVGGAHSSGAAIVSFNQDAFNSYGKKQGANAPISLQAAFAYTTALNELLRKDSLQKLQIGDATTVYWADATDSKEAAAAERVASWLFRPALPEGHEAAEMNAFLDILSLVLAGRPLEYSEFHLKDSTRLYILGLSPNASRLSVRFWGAMTLGAMSRAFNQHWHDMRMEELTPRRALPSAASCALMTAPARRDKSGHIRFSFDHVSPILSGELMRAILTGARYPDALLANLVMRVRTDHYVNRLRVSLIKATIVRARRMDSKEPTVDNLVRADPNDTSPGRRLGRLFALLERAERTALSHRINLTIKDKYIGVAAASPAQVFPSLVRSSQHHIMRLRRGCAGSEWIEDAQHLGRLGMSLERDIGLLLGSFDNRIPRQLSTIDQGIFFISYYQERFGGKTNDESNHDFEPVQPSMDE